MMSDAPTDVEFSVNFVQQDEFKESYFRNNRACGQKNIRCFPTCSDEHVEKHFCGKPLRVVLDMLIRRPNKEYRGIDDIRLIAEFKVLESEYGVISSVKGSILKSKIKSKYTPTNPYFLGKVVEAEAPRQLPCGGILHRCVVDFNAECKGWHYAWVGSRFKTCVSHVIAVTILSIDRKASNTVKAAALTLDDEDSSSTVTAEGEGHRTSGNNGGEATEQSRTHTEIDAIMFKPVAHFDSPPFQVASLRRKSDRTDYLLGSAAATQRHEQILLQQQHAQTLSSPSPYISSMNGFSLAYPQPYNMGLVGMGMSAYGLSESLCYSARSSDPEYTDFVHSSSSTAPLGSLSCPMLTMSAEVGSQSAVSDAPVAAQPSAKNTIPPAPPLPQQVTDGNPVFLLSSPSAEQNWSLSGSDSRAAGQSSAGSTSSSAQYQRQLQQYYSDMMSQQTRPQRGATSLADSHLTPHSPQIPAPSLASVPPTADKLGCEAVAAASKGRTILGLPEEVFADIADTYSAAIAVTGSQCKDTPPSLADFPTDSVIERAIEVIDRALSQDTARTTASSAAASGMAEPAVGDTSFHSVATAEDESISAGSKRKRLENRDELVTPVAADRWLLGSDVERSEMDADTVAQVATALHDPTGSIALLAMVADYICSGAYEAALVSQKYALTPAPYSAAFGSSNSLASYPQSVSFPAPSPYDNPAVLLQPYALDPAQQLGLCTQSLPSYGGMLLPPYNGYPTVDHSSSSKRPQKCPRCGELKKGHQCSATMHPAPLPHQTAAFPQFIDSFVMPVPEDVTLSPPTNSLRSVL